MSRITMRTAAKKPADARPGTEPSAAFPSRDERLSAGKALRETLPHGLHAAWKKQSKARDPIAILEESNRDRLPELVPIRYGRMLRSPFTFLRGSAGLMAYDLSTLPSTGLRVQACGDCHLSELRPVRDARAQPGLRHQRFRRDPARALGVGCQAPGRQLCRGRSRQRPAPTRTPGTRPSSARAPTGNTCATIRRGARWTSGTNVWTSRP